MRASLDRIMMLRASYFHISGTKIIHPWRIPSPDLLIVRNKKKKEETQQWWYFLFIMEHGGGVDLYAALYAKPASKHDSSSTPTYLRGRLQWTGAKHPQQIIINI